MLESTRAVLMVGAPAGACAAAVAPAEMPLSFAPSPGALSWTGASAAGWKDTTAGPCPALSPAEWTVNVLAMGTPASLPELLVALLACPAPLPELFPVLFPEPFPAALPEPFRPSAPEGAPATGALAPAANAEGCDGLAACVVAAPPLERAGVCAGVWVAVEALSIVCTAAAPPTFAGSAGPDVFPIVFAGTLAGVPEGSCAACGPAAELPRTEVVWAAAWAGIAGNSAAAEPVCTPATGDFALSPAASGALVSPGKAVEGPARAAEACPDWTAKPVPSGAAAAPPVERPGSVEG